MSTPTPQMDNNNDTQLEAAVDRLLRGLPPLRAPETLIPRVMAAVMPAARLHWYRRPWQTWPVALQLGSLAVALAFCAGLSIGIEEFVHALRWTYVAAQVNSMLGVLSAVYQAISTLADAFSLVLRRVSTGWLVACGALALLSYGACVGLGTIFARLAWVRNPQKLDEP